MSSASLLSLLYSGLQDDRLLPPKGIPKIDTFQRVFHKSGRFTTEWFRLNFDGKAGFGKTARATVPRRGHLITRAFLVTVMPDIQGIYKAAAAAAPPGYTTQPVFGWTNSVGHALVQQAELTIAGEPIDTLDGRLMEVLDEFHTPLEKVTTVNRMLGRVDNGFTAKTNGHTATNQEVITPLPFWFMRGDPAAALPIDAISLDAVQINISYSSLNSLYVSEPPFAFTQSNIGSTSNTSNAGSNISTTTASSTIYCIGNTPYYIPLTDTTFTYINGSNVLTSTFTTPANLDIVDSYILLEYVYLDKPEASRIRLANIEYPIVQHYPFIYETKGSANAKISLSIPNLTRDIYFMAHRPEADSFNAPFLATRDLNASGTSGTTGTLGVWWPDAQGLGKRQPLIPAYSVLDSEPIASIALLYEGSLVRYATDMPALFRSILPGMEQIKSPWHNKYYYHIPFGTQHEQFGITNAMGHANLDKIRRVELDLIFKPFRGSLQSSSVPRYTVYIWAETYNLLRVYGGRAGLLFGY
jgi:hypothetical protein